MSGLLSDVEVRVLGSLIEKQISTPEYYPLSLNALVNACNQLSNREPVVKYDDATVLQAIKTLREKGLAHVITGDSRVPKYAHVLAEFFDLALQEISIMCVLMLRGAQTAGEIRGRTSRLYNFADLEEVELTIQGLIDRTPQPLILRLPRQPGTKESRFMHLLSGADNIVEVKEQSPKVERSESSSALISRVDNDRINQLENEIAGLREELAELKDQFKEFKKQFE